MADWNAAQRLFEILEATKSVDATRSAREVWAWAFGLDKEDRPGLFRALAQLDDLANEVEASIKGLPDARNDLYLTNFPRIRKAIRLAQLEGSWEPTYRQLLNEVALRDLQFCADKLRTVYHEEKLSDDVLSDLAKQVDALFESVIAAQDLDAELRKVLLTCLETFRRAIADYRIRGGSGLRDAVVKTVGELLTVRESAEKNSKHPVLKGLWKVVVKTETVLMKAMNYRQIANAIRLALNPSDLGDV